jgi:SH3 domain-containing protein
MIRLLLFLSLGCAAVYAANTLYFDQTPLSTRTAEADAPAGQAPGVRRLSSWGPYLPGEAESEKRSGSLAASQPTTPPARENTSDQAKSLTVASGQNPEANADQSAAQEKVSLAAIDADQQSDEWAKVTLAARVHSEASVSSPTVGYYRPGTELRVVARQNGWLQLSDPVTQKRGWVFEKYLASIDGPILAQAGLESPADPGLSESVPSKPVLPRSKKRARPASPVIQLPVKPVVRVAEDAAVAEPGPRNGRWARRAERRRAFAPFMFGPSAGF